MRSATFVLLFALACVSFAEEEKKLKIGVYYESLCPDSLRFITKQLNPSWSDVSEYVDITFIPFGKSESVKDGEYFRCQHGPEECKGNRIQSCALDALTDQTKEVEFVNCFMTEYNKYSDKDFGEVCIENAGLKVEDVKNCFDSDKGKELQLQAEKDTIAISPKFVPTVVYNEVFDQKLQQDSMTDFKGTACKLIKENHPNAC
ncbi:PREDICTED: GILT-like protein F37H8.5 [Nicrophorus vespilloides]|uniref:GILT-like protein F37H8.5 n=1 Tax=Nicrophorus vespilloides TaxID=110193 RepID=A0ABM1M507_NICVS|nr:PREDICTED: GILT-like protein F37H8.5 [Nicrophorus vespilloides]